MRIQPPIRFPYPAYNPALINRAGAGSANKRLTDAVLAQLRASAPRPAPAVAPEQLAPHGMLPVPAAQMIPIAPGSVTPPWGHMTPITAPDPLQTLLHVLIGSHRGYSRFV